MTTSKYYWDLLCINGVVKMNEESHLLLEYYYRKLYWSDNVEYWD